MLYSVLRLRILRLSLVPTCIYEPAVFNDLSARVRAIKPFPTLAVSKLASQFHGMGRDIIRSNSNDDISG